MILNYLSGAVLGLICGAISGFFTQGGLGKRQRKLFLRLLRKKGRIRRQRLLCLSAGLLLGLIGVWICDGVNRSFAGFITVMSCLFHASLTDLRKREIHLDAMLFYALALLIYQLSAADWSVLLSALIGGAVGAALLGVPYLLRRNCVGVGDIALLAVCGLYYGARGVIALLLRALILLAVVALVQLLRRRATKESELPIAPFLFFSALI